MPPSASLFRSLFKLATLLLLAGYTNTIAPTPPRNPSPPATFSHDLFDQFLQRAVDDSGRVAYAALEDGADDLEAYYALVARYSPDSHPDLFPDRPAQLAYWINAYNAATLKTVLAHYPISSVGDVDPPALFFFFPERSGFFYFQRVLVGGEKISLYHLEKDLILQRFAEPRLHFALNCASKGCPRLPRRAFTATDLEGQLERETRRFLAETRNMRLDHPTKTLWLSSIFQWYENDFIQVLNGQGTTPTLVDYIAPYLNAEEVRRLRQDTYQIAFVPYDWGLNDQMPTR